MSQIIEKACLSSTTIELSESESYLSLVDRVCYYGEPNLNNVKLPIEGAEEAAQTLVDMPVVAAYQVNADGLPDLKGHEVSIDPVTNEVKFGTLNIGTHTSVEIKDDVVEIGGIKRTLPCLFANLKIWKRNKNVCAAIKRLYSEGKLHNSWEIVSEAYTFENNIKTLNDYRFEANCLLGQYHPAAYGKASTVLSLSEADPSVVIAEALAQDIASLADKEESMGTNEVVSTVVIEGIPMEEIAEITEQSDIESVLDEQIEAEEEVKTEETEIEEAETEVEESEVEESEVIEEVEVESASITVRDLYDKLNKACREKIDAWCYVWQLFPVDQICWCIYDSERELDYIKFTYTVVGEYVEVGEPEYLTLTASVAEMEKSIQVKNDALAEANDRIQELQSQVGELLPYKEAKEAAEYEAAKEEIVKFALKSRQISEKEIKDEASEVYKHISELNISAIKEIIADRMVSAMEKQEKVISTAEKHERAALTVDEISAKSLVGMYIHKK